MRKPKLVVSQGEHDYVGFLRRGFLKSSSSSPFLADRGDSKSSHFSSSLLDAPSVLDGSFMERLVEFAGGVRLLSFEVVFVMFQGRVQVQGARG
jgi:hypothetical protein